MESSSETRNLSGEDKEYDGTNSSSATGSFSDKDAYDLKAIIRIVPGHTESIKQIKEETRLNQEKMSRFILESEARVNSLVGDFEMKIAKQGESLEKKIEESKIKTIETLGIFVALFTFIGVEFQVFKSFTGWEAAASLTFILLGALSFMMFSLHVFLHDELKTEIILEGYWLIILFILMFLGTGVYLFGKSGDVQNDAIPRITPSLITAPSPTITIKIKKGGYIA